MLFASIYALARLLVAILPVRAQAEAERDLELLARRRSPSCAAMSSDQTCSRPTHNLLVWTKAALFAGTRLAAAHTRELVGKIIRVPAFRVRHGSALRLELPAVGVLARELREALCPTAAQLPLPIRVCTKDG